MAVRPITDTLRHLRGGVFQDEASEALAALVKIVAETGKPGSLTLKLDVKRISKSGAMTIKDTITVKAPKEEAIETMLFSTVEGNLVTEDPHQMKLALKQVQSATADVKTIDVDPLPPKVVAGATE